MKPHGESEGLGAIRIITTGGTIGSRIDPATGGAVPAVSAEELVSMTPGLADLGEIRVTDFGLLQSWNIGPPIMADLAAVVTSSLRGGAVAGAVVTHGTDTMEETAFALDLLVDSDKPVVVTGAMRNASDAEFDGPRNLLAAARVAADESARGRGAMIVMNGEIHAARFATKTHTTAFQTFASPESRAIGVVDDRVRFRFDLERMPKVPIGRAEPGVYLVKMAAGTDDLPLRALLEARVAGAVIEGSGAGNVADAWHEPIAALIAARIPVVLVSRCLAGRIVPAYGGRGGGRTLRGLGVIDGGWLSGPKARVALSLALGAGMGEEELRAFFQRLTGCDGMESERPDIVARASSIEGLGLFAARAFLAGQRIAPVTVVREVTPETPIREDFGERIEHCAYPDGRTVLIGFPERHVNHSCDPNAWERFEGGAASLVARRAIASGDEITIDYNVNITEGTSWPCHCGAGRCRGEVAGDFFELPLEWQREYRPLLAEWFVRRNRAQVDALDATA